MLFRSTEDRRWCQYCYQFAHEFTHILAGFDDELWKRNNWFEETLCEVASLYVLRQLSEVWQTRPPQTGLKSYAPEFRRYAQGVMDQRQQVAAGQLSDFYQKHRAALEASPKNRDLNGAMAIPLLTVMEGAPAAWEAVGWLNARPSPEGQTFKEYMAAWREAVPLKHRPVVDEMRRLFGV